MKENGLEGKIVEKLREEQSRQIRRKRRRSLCGWLIGLSVLAVAAGIFLLVQIKGNEHFETTYYTVESEKIENPVRIAVLSDLHDREFGEGNFELIEAIRNEKVDLICMVGDMINRSDSLEDMDVIRDLCTRLTEIAPVYYCPGNHESSLHYGNENPINIGKILTETGTVVTAGTETGTVEVNGETLLIASVESNEDLELWGGKKELEDHFWGSEEFKLLLCHFPGMFYDTFRDADFDLALAGHYHGGQIRLPVLGGLYVPGQGFFPAYSGGMYRLTYGTLIVSRGLGEEEETIPVPRINNRPELVIVELR